MIPCHVAQIKTPKKYLLNGLWFGPAKPRAVIIWVHGLTSSAFSKLGIVEKLVTEDTAVLTFNNRGHDTVTRVGREDKKSPDGFRYEVIGGAHEKFTDCVDDIQGAIDLAKKQGVRQIFLAGHSTGCQKSIYYQAQMGRKSPVRGIILLAPISDYASNLFLETNKKRLRADIERARMLVKRGKPHDAIRGRREDAQRFLSLNTPDSAEEIFTYAHTRTPRTLKKMHIPLLVFFAENDEYSDRPAHELAHWFAHETATASFRVEIVSRATHSFKGAEKYIANTIADWKKAV